MPRIPGIPEIPPYISVEDYLSHLAKLIAELVDNPAKKKRFREQLRTYQKSWKVWTTFDEANRKGCWKPRMGRPEPPLNVFSPVYCLSYDLEKEARRLAGCYSLLAFIHDKELPHLNKINNKIIVSADIIERTLAEPNSQITGDCIGRAFAETHLIEEYFNRVSVDLEEYCDRITSPTKDKGSSEAEHIQKAEKLSDVALFNETARRFKARTLFPLGKDETWYDLDSSLKPWFDLALQRLQHAAKTKPLELLQYEYGNLLHYARGINIKSFRGFRDLRLIELAGRSAKQLAKKFEDIAQETQRAFATEKPAGKGEQGSGEKAGDTQRADGLTGEALALAMLVKHPEWSDTKIAKAVGVYRTTLYDWPNFKKAKEVLKEGKKELPRGSKNGDTGDVEAWEADT